jgi:uncharacterized membrane protein
VKRIFRILLTVSSVLYPFFLLASLLWLHLSPRFMILGLGVIGLFYFLANYDNAVTRGPRGLQFWMIVSSIGGLAAVTFITQNAGLLRFYPVFINLVLLANFAITWFQGPPMVYRLAVLQDKTILDSPNRAAIETYCTIVTHIWCVFFIQNTLMSAATALWANETVWSLYNGCVSYILIGALLGGEFVFRKIKMGR